METGELLLIQSLGLE